MSMSPLLVSRDPSLLDDVRRVAAVAGSEPLIVSSAAQARGAWALAPLVLVGEDLLAEVAAAGLPERRGLLVVGRDSADVAVWQGALAAGAEHVVVLPEGEAYLAQRLVPGTGSPRAHVVGVVGGSGGAGASVLAVALALAGARLGLDVALVDADPSGGGLDLALAAEDEQGARWSDFVDVSGILPPDTVLAALPVVHGVTTVSVGRAPESTVPSSAVPAVVDSLVACRDLVVIDLPRARPDLLATLVPRCAAVLLVVTPDVRGVAAGRHTAMELGRLGEVSVVVRGVPGTELDAEQVAHWLEVELVAEIAYDARLTAALDCGDPPGLSARSRLGRTATALVTRLMER